MRADTIALSFTGGLHAPATQTLTAGWAFSVSTPIELTQLGLWDRFDNGLQEAHAVRSGPVLARSWHKPQYLPGTSLIDGFRCFSYQSHSRPCRQLDDRRPL